MAHARRRTQWIDIIASDLATIAGAAAPGTIVQTNVLLESELEELHGGATLIRIIGDIWTVQSAGAPVITHSLLMLQNYTGAVAPTDWANDEFQRHEMIGTWMIVMDSGSTIAHHTMVDLRSKRKMRQGMALTLQSQNHRVAGHDATFALHLRCLLLLP